MSQPKRKGLLVVVSGPSGVGKTTICQQVAMKIPNIVISISCTTRRPRYDEEPGKDYYFLDEGGFQSLLDKDDFVEWHEVYGYKYGTLKQPIIDVLEKGETMLLILNSVGARAIKDEFPEAIRVAITPPSFPVLTQRLESRLEDEQMQERLKCASDEIADCTSYEYHILNDDLIIATHELISIITEERSF